jgi:hypothetical protein
MKAVPRNLKMSGTRAQRLKPQVGAELFQRFLALFGHFHKPQPGRAVLAMPGDLASGLEVHPLPAESQFAFLAGRREAFAFDAAAFQADAHDDDFVPRSAGRNKQLALATVKISWNAPSSFHGGKYNSGPNSSATDFAVNDLVATHRTEKLAGAVPLG